MNVEWVKHFKTQQERDEFKKLLLANQKVLDTLSKILYTYIRESENATNDYDSPSWAYKAAHHNGRIEATKKILKLLDLSNET
jgi:hypothetical protein